MIVILPCLVNLKLTFMLWMGRYLFSRFTVAALPVIDPGLSHVAVGF